MEEPMYKILSAICIFFISISIYSQNNYSFDSFIIPTVAKNEFITPENTINYWIERVRSNDFAGSLKAFAINQMTSGFNYNEYAKFFRILMADNQLLPEEYSDINRTQFIENALNAYRSLILSSLLSNEYVKSYNLQTTPENITNFRSKISASKLKVLKIVKMQDIKNELSGDALLDYMNNNKIFCRIYGCDDATIFTIFVDLEGAISKCSQMRLLKYNGNWLIASAGFLYQSK
jgi:hypothetical protein